MSKKSIVPPTGDYNTWYSKFVLPQGLSGNISVAGWTKGNEGFIQQTFLGASIISFNVSAGFGDTTSTLSAQLVNDEYNKSDNLGLGLGDDVYHNGEYDMFAPPPVGTPVFFKFGKNFATIEQAWRKTFDDTYGYSTIPQEKEEKYITLDSFDNVPPYHYFDLEKSKKENALHFIDLSEYYQPDPNGTGLLRGNKHFIFGGILQSYTQNKGPDGNPVYSIQMVDPREILSNCSIILKNYAGSTFGNKNYFNVFGFLEHDVSDQLKAKIESSRIPGFSSGPIATVENWIAQFPFPGVPAKVNNNLEKIVDPATGNSFYYGNDMYRFPEPIGISEEEFPQFFPMTGQGFARVSDQGIPWYRIKQALDALFNYNGFLPQEYIDAGYGGPINFRGFNYVVDFGGIPLEKIPQMYFMDYEQLDLLSMAQELCDIISHDMFVSLLPVINHPASKFLYDYNNYWIKQALKFPEGSTERNLRLGKVVSGIIRIDAINRSDAPSPGSIKSYLESLESRGVFVKNQDLGYELSNVTTDKIVVGAQEVEMYYFTGAKDKDNNQVRRRKLGLDNGAEYLQGAQWSLSTMLNQQIIPFYGFLGKDAVTIPRGFGAYQQIMLDATGLDAYGVGNYYIATEIELRAALVSYEKWRDFILQYNDVYIEEFTENQILLSNLSAKATGIVEGLNETITKYGQKINWGNRDFGVSVPRCVFDSDKNYMGPDGFPASRCSPPYGYPLYYQRASAIGIPEAGLAGIQNAFTQLIKFSTDPAEKEKLNIYVNMINEANVELSEQINQAKNDLTGAVKESNAEEIKQKRETLAALKQKQDEIKKLVEDGGEMVAFIRDLFKSGTYQNIQRTGKKTFKNARKVYDFVKDVAEKHLGKTFLVKIPKACNVFYSKEISLWQNGDPTYNIKTGPFGFKPQTITSNIGYYTDNGYQNDTNLLSIQATVSQSDYFEHYLYNNFGTYYRTGALKNNFNPISEKWEFNYEPEPQGGFFNFSIYSNNIPFSNIQEYTLDGSKLPQATLNMLAPQDLTNFVENGRIQCYVRFNDSQYLDLSQISKDSFTQQAYSPEGFIPDILEELDNVSFDSNEGFGQNGEILSSEGRPRTVAFVKCSLDSKFYMAPRVISKDTQVWARDVKYLPNFGQPRELEIKENGCNKKIPVIPYSKPIFWIKNGGSDGAVVSNTDFVRYYDQYTNSNLVSTDIQNLDPDHVYALITLPGKIVPTIETRYRDGILTAMNNTKFKNLLTVDVVKGVAGFEKPPEKNGKKVVVDCDHPNLVDYKTSDLISAIESHKSTIRGLSLDSPHNKLAFTSPSPVFPDLIAIPLLSKERCYGPWLSTSVANVAGDSRLRYSDIGGKVEFVKDENLAPWNYAGYQLMNEAGTLQAQFSNSLLLFSENGGFVLPEAPTGISLAKALKSGGPLVTSISVDIGNEISTTVKMDLYTSRFGKLQKQKELAIGGVARQRQKIIDQTNANIRRGMGKNATNASVNQILSAAGGSKLQSVLNKGNVFYSDLEKGAEPISNLVISARKKTEPLIPVTSQVFFGSTGEEQEYNAESITINSSLQSNNYLSETASMFSNSQDAQEAFENSAIVNFADIFTPASKSINSANLPTVENNNAAFLIQQRNLGNI
jgi:hypothetical protein